MITKHVRNREILTFNDGLLSIGALGGAQFAYGTAKTVTAMKKTMDGLKAAKANTPDFDKFLQEKVELQKKYALHDAEDKEVTAPFEEEWNFYVIDPAKYGQYLKEAEAKQKKYAKVITEQLAKRQEYTMMLDAEDDISVHSIKPSMMPDDITVGQAWNIMLMFDISADKVAKQPVKFNNLALMNYQETFAAIWNLQGIKFVTAMLPNMMAIYQKAQEVRYAQPVMDFYNVFERKRYELCEEMSEKDVFGLTKFKRRNTGHNRVMIDYIISDQKAFDEALEALRKKHKKLLDAYEAFLMTELDLDMNVISQAAIEETYNLSETGDKQSIKGYQMTNIVDFLE